MNLLCIDDDPGRYGHLRQLLEPKGIIFEIACCRLCVEDALPQASAVLLDYDLDSGDYCAKCGLLPDQSRSKGLMFIPTIEKYKIPVVVTSAAGYESVARMCTELKARNIPHRQHRATDIDPELKWVAALYLLGVL